MPEMAMMGRKKLSLMVCITSIAMLLGKQQVGDDQVRDMFPGQFQRLLPVGGLHHVKIVFFQEFLQQQADLFFVVND